MFLLHKNFVGVWFLVSFYCTYTYNPTSLSFSGGINSNYFPVGILLEIDLDYTYNHRKYKFKSFFGLLFVLGFVLVLFFSIPSVKIYILEQNTWSVLLPHFSFLFIWFCCRTTLWHPLIGSDSVGYLWIFYKYQICPTCVLIREVWISDLCFNTSRQQRSRRSRLPLWLF